MTNEQKPTRLLRMKHVLERVGVGRATIYRWMQAGRFPKPCKFGTRFMAWREADIEAWMRERFGESSNA